MLRIVLLFSRKWMPSSTSAVRVHRSQACAGAAGSIFLGARGGPTVVTTAGQQQDALSKHLTDSCVLNGSWIAASGGPRDLMRPRDGRMEDAGAVRSCPGGRQKLRCPRAFVSLLRSDASSIVQSATHPDDLRQCHGRTSRPCSCDCRKLTTGTCDTKKSCVTASAFRALRYSCLWVRIANRILGEDLPFSPGKRLNGRSHRRESAACRLPPALLTAPASSPPLAPHARETSVGTSRQTVVASQAAAAPGKHLLAGTVAPSQSFLSGLPSPAAEKKLRFSRGERRGRRLEEGDMQRAASAQGGLRVIAKHGDHNERDGGASPPQGVDLQPRTPDGPADASGMALSEEAGARQVLLSSPPQQTHGSAPEVREGGGEPALAQILPEHVAVCTEHAECDDTTGLEELPEHQASPGVHQDVDDTVLVAHLQKHGFDNSVGELTCDVLVRYGNSIFIAWMDTGVIWQKISHLMRRHGRTVTGGRSIWTPEEADELRWSTLAEGMRHVQAKIQNGEWNPHGGASLKTYFINACLWKFLNEYRKFWRVKNGAELVMDNITIPRHEPDPEETSIARETIKERLRPLKLGLQQIIHLRALGYTVPEIAEILGLTVKTVECRLSRYYKSNPWEGVGDE